MARAGCVQVQVGVESGSPEVLAAMDKRATVAETARGLATCHDAGIATFVTVILGFPGETARTIEQTWHFLRDARPDFAFATPFTVRVPFVPVLSAESRARFALETRGGPRSSSPYWRHRTMSAAEVGPAWRTLHRRLAAEQVSLDPSLFYGSLFSYRRERDRAPLLAFQRDALVGRRWVAAALAPLRWGSLLALRIDQRRAFARPSEAALAAADPPRLYRGGVRGGMPPGAPSA